MVRIPVFGFLASGKQLVFNFALPHFGFNRGQRGVSHQFLGRCFQCSLERTLRVGIGKVASTLPSVFRNILRTIFLKPLRTDGSKGVIEMLAPVRSKSAHVRFLLGGCSRYIPIVQRDSEAGKMYVCVSNVLIASSVALAATDHARPAPQGGREHARPRAGRDPLFFLKGVQPC